MLSEREKEYIGRHRKGEREGGYCYYDMTLLSQHVGLPSVYILINIHTVLELVWLQISSVLYRGIYCRACDLVGLRVMKKSTTTTPQAASGPQA